MARTSKKASRKPKAKPKAAKSSKKANPRKGKPARAKSLKSAKSRGPARKAPKAKAPKLVHDAAHEHHMAEIRAQVARRRPGMAPMVTHGHEQQDASIVPPPPPPPAPVDTLHQNWGDAKERAVTRNDKPTNWFRQAPKPKGK